MYGILDKFSSYNISMYKDILINILYLLPEYLIVLVFSFFISSIVNSNGTSIIFSIGMYLGSSIINDIVISNNIKSLYWIPSLCWNLNYDYNSMIFNVVIDVSVIFILLILTFILFKKREIKNT